MEALTASLLEASSKLVSSAVGPSTPIATKPGEELEESGGLLSSSYVCSEPESETFGCMSVLNLV